jgi:hypothetical protein
MLACQVALAAAAEPVIGMVNADGSFSIDNARVFRHATLFEGNIVETAQASSTLDLTGGARVQLAAASKGRVFRDHLVLERGVSQVQGANYIIEALALRVAPAAPDASAKVTRLATDRIEVASLAGAVRVTNSEGIMLADLEAGRVLEFTAEPPGAATPSTVTGFVRMAGQAYVLTDEVTGVTVELSGSGINFSQYAGKRVQATGRLLTAPGGGTAPQVLTLSTIKLLKAAGAATPNAAETTVVHAGIAGGHAVMAGVVITVVAVAGAVAGVMVTRDKAPTISPGR